VEIEIVLHKLGAGMMDRKAPYGFSPKTIELTNLHPASCNV